LLSSLSAQNFTLGIFCLQFGGGGSQMVAAAEGRQWWQFKRRQ
jgi:hypothetical protein